MGGNDYFKIMQLAVMNYKMRNKVINIEHNCIKYSRCCMFRLVFTCSKSHSDDDSMGPTRVAVRILYEVVFDGYFFIAYFIGNDTF